MRVVAYSTIYYLIHHTSLTASVVFVSGRTKLELTISDCSVVLESKSAKEYFTLPALLRAWVLDECMEAVT
jgi:hypothetical protein